ncbi:MAG: DAK2 domain-containing protein [Acutalibacteraceae bacterium]
MITGSELKKAIISGANNIINQKAEIDALNIFPVPDGDTGTNMSMTITAAKNELLNLPDDATVSQVASKTASALLRGARGNSGVILSLIFRGFSKGLKDMDTADAKSITNALGLGVDAAYKAVMKPTEGTILTVARVAYEKSSEVCATVEDTTEIWQVICDSADEALLTTPDLLPVLKKAGVVDAGGKGLCVIFEGMLSVLKDGIVIEDASEESASDTSEDAFRSAAAEFDSDIRFTYCTEFIIGRSAEAVKTPLDLRAYLETIGDCVVVVDDDEIIKVHVHTEQPGNALQAALEHGQLLTVKVENMKEQHRKAAESNEAAKAQQQSKPVEEEKPKFAGPTEEIGFVAVAAGDGIKSLFSDLGCSSIVSGGQSMNPSTDDILDAILATPAKNVFVLPNNKNIILAAEQTIPLVEDRNVIIIPTRTIPQGMVAMLAYDFEAGVEDNRRNMMDAMANVATGQVTFAARDSEFGSTKIKKGEIIALENGKLTITEKESYVKAAVKLTKSMLTRNTSFITVIYGNGVTEEEANEACEQIKAKAGNSVEVTLVNGGQPVYYFIISIE